jgi:hypothetical protein
MRHVWTVIYFPDWSKRQILVGRDETFPGGIDSGTVRQLWETSQDEGETWEVGFDWLYTKVAVKSEKAEEDRVKGEK